MSVKIDLSTKTALITGATRGIGKSISDAFLDAGAKVILTGTNQDEIDLLNAQNEYSSAKWMVADFSTLESIDAFIEHLRKIDTIDICINNAGINIIKPYEECSVDEYQQLININLTAPFSLTQQLLPDMKNRGFGRIVNIASIWSKISKI